MDASQEKEVFITHYNYADCLADLVNNSSLSYNLKLNRRKLADLEEKENLIKLTSDLEV